MSDTAPSLSETARPDRRLAAIMASDIVGYSRRMQADEAATLAALGSLRDLTAAQIERHQGRIANTAGDSIMAEFPSAVDAVSCAIILQEVLAQHSGASAELQTRIGVSMGDVVYRNGDVFGTAVNIAARLETLAQPGGIAISGAVRDDIAGKLPVAFADLGLRELKNIAEPIRVFSLVPQIGASPAAIENVDRRTRPSPEPRLSIAILPFLNMSNDAEQEFFADGITEDLITEISRIGDSLVIARNTVFTYKGRSVDIARIGKELGVRYVLEGSVRRLGSRVRITAQLIETSTGSHLWAEKYDRDLADLFEVQDEVVRAVAASTHTRLMINEGDLAEQATGEDLDFWTLAARGRRELYRGTRESLHSAEEIGRRLVALDPQSTKAHQIHASAMLKLATMGFRQGSPETTARIANAAREAARLGPQDEYSLFIYGLVLSTLLGRPEEAILQFKQALRINPNFSAAYATIGSAYTMLGKPDDAIAKIEMSIRLDPRDPTIYHRYAALADANFEKRDYRQTLHWARQAIALRPDYWYPNALAVAALALDGDGKHAMKLAEKLKHSLPNATIANIRTIMYFSDGFWERLSEGLALAGLPKE